MYLKSDFDTAVENVIDNYPAVAARYKTGDPTVVALIGSITQVAAMLSQQLEIEGIEAFQKVRDATVLADAALRGLVPQATPSRVSLSVQNTDIATYTLAAGRLLTDAGGNAYVVDTPVTVAAGQTGTAECLQQTQRTLSVTIDASQPFYQILVPPAADGSFIAGISVADSAGNEFTYTPGFTNVSDGERVYNVECDEYQNIYVRFGYGGVVGYQPATGETFIVTINDTVGELNIAAGSPFSLDYTLTPQDSLIKLSLNTLLTAGEDPIDVATLRELCKYPSAYDENAVYLGEFDFLIRRNLPGLQFLSVWNEEVEESVRGASVDNINTLFIAFVPPAGGDQTTYETLITQLIAGADDSYKIKFVAVNVVPIGATIAAQVARVNDASAVQAQILQTLLGAYGQTATPAQSGMFSVQYKAIYALLRANIAALQDSNSDFNVVIAPDTTQKPEDWRYMSPESVTITVTLANYQQGYWGN
ncbi:hypothetical protein [Paraburkholderia domus]|uniref:hypothetical protein n=1 Tax=Paraburkholderia domus TaxID=2793075 RepID=UPI0019140398|nr:hypothetical protein [Paraburkholderia domus]MBK5061845.1 hypothetical protein [Burkholderia sp. R-70199]CAE6901532.1 hypothetical protein R70199_03725 [Paraburkholderia domus]